ncbi:gamma-glutamyl-gamma-aminobutyrate hydrolase family protein [Liquorilactobacillus uvarum]|uniref:gamma-glutamyl-gamma-aminobutyrate hydrolase family protein n=1 Tax=Liquorilactobacillus uvarum TaxID=303240 RepID=UPI002889609F|nr:type 1 glutamine amidotransferase [Liquorilactobacillus uvarum]
MSKRDIIGIPAGVMLSKGTRRYYINEADVRGITKAGGVPVMIPSEATVDIDYYVRTCDGFFFTGGPDVLPTFYGEEPHAKMGFSDIQRDRLELSLAKKALTAGKKMLGICRGMQVINVALGGTLYQDLESEYDSKPNHLIKHFQAAPSAEPTHYAAIKSGTRLNKLYGSKWLVNSRHHQAVKEIAKGLKVTATAGDGVIEGLESENNNQIFAVQWHPEMLVATDEKMQMIFDEFVK